MALAVTDVVNVAALSNQTGSPKYITTATVTFDSSYPTGGEDLDADEFGLTDIEFALVNPRETGTEQVIWDKSAEKLLVFTADGTQASNASDQSAVYAEVLVIGS